jgi:hypothetical protein
VIPPLRTAATTAALRRTTHLFVFGGGRLASVPASDSLESVSSRGTWDADDPTSPERGPLVTGLVGRMAAFPLVLGSTAQPLRLIHSRLFHEVFTISSVFVTRIFHLFKGPKKGFARSPIEQLPQEIKDAGGTLPAECRHATLMPRQVPSIANR